MNIGQRLKECRENANQTQSELAKKTGISQQNISRWEKNINTPNAMDCIRLADHFGISLDELLGRQDYITGSVVITGPQLTTDEKQLIDLYRKLPVRDKAELVGFAKGLAY
ncbi:MAG: helix-turn-helix transcriptional regulator [Clostridia bacterium]|nr:helix-turn-helix transcriptional regulator [Clostridia bacterium]